MERRKQVRRDPDQLDTLCSVWILACNDENPIISYKGLEDRLGLSEADDICGLIRSRRELFREGVPAVRLERWKNDMLAGRHLPSWIREISDKSARDRAIESLGRNDVFRSQFRTGKDSPKSSIEVIDWGLQHIDRLRKVSLEARAQTAKRWEIWLVFVLALANIIVTIVLHCIGSGKQ